MTWQKKIALLQTLLLTSVFLIGCKMDLDVPNKDQNLTVTLDLHYERSVIRPETSELSITDYWVCIEPAACGMFGGSGSYSESRFEYGGQAVTSLLVVGDVKQTRQLDIYVRQNGQTNETKSYVPPFSIPEIVVTTPYISFSDATFRLNLNPSASNYTTSNWVADCDGLELENFLSVDFGMSEVNVVINPNQLAVPEIPTGCELVFNYGFGTDLVEGVINDEYQGDAQFGNKFRVYYSESVRITIIK